MTNLQTQKNNIEQVYNFFYEYDFLKEADRKSRIIAKHNQSIKENNLIFDKLINEIAKTTNIETIQAIKNKGCYYDLAFLYFDKRKSINELLHIANVGNLMYIANHILIIKRLTNKLNDKEIDFKSLQEYAPKNMIEQAKNRIIKLKDMQIKNLSGEIFNTNLFYRKNLKEQRIIILNEIEKLEFALKFKGFLTYKCISYYNEYLHALLRINETKTQQTNLKLTA